MLKVGVIGLGVMGRVHFRNWQAMPDAGVVAVCEANPDVLANATVATGNLDAQAGAIDLSGVAVYADLDEMLNNEHLDAISITLPTHLHADITIKILNKGVNVLCEKPMALNLADCDRMIAAAEKSGKQLMIAHCIRFWPEYVWAKDMIDSGRYGKVLVADFCRLTAAPGWGKGSWFADSSKSGGVALDLHVHDIDYVQYVFGMPKQITSRCASFANGTPGHIVTEFGFGDSKVVTAVGSWMMPQSFGFKMGFNIVLEKGFFVFDSQQSPALKVYPVDGDSFVPEVLAGDGYKHEIEYFAALLTGSSCKVMITTEEAKESVGLALESVAPVGLLGKQR